MVPDAIVMAPLLLAAVLITAAVSKLRDPRSADDSFRALGVPALLATPVLVAAHPWIELSLALLILITSGWIGTLSALGATALMLAYLALIIRAAQGPDEVDCECFGAWGASAVTWRTVVRNVWYVLLAVVTVWAHASGAGPLSVLAGLDPQQWWWLGAAAAVALTVLLTVPAAGPAAVAGTSLGTDDGASDEDLEDYIRVRTPAVPVTLSDGTIRSLRALSASKAQVLLFVSTTCRMCQPIIEQATTWQDSLPVVDVRLVYMTALPEGASSDELTLYDSDGWVYDTLGLQGTPSAVALGVDGQLAGGPVVGADAVMAFITDLEAELADTPLEAQRGVR